MNITGRLTRDAAVQTTANGKQVVNFSVAVNDSYRNKQGERVEQTAYFDCSYWRTPNVVQVLTKGLIVELSGRVSAKAWIGKDGEAKAGLNFHTSEIKLLSASRKTETPQSTISLSHSETEDNLPF